MTAVVERDARTGLLVDAGAMGAASAAICGFGHDLAVMVVAVPALLVVRHLLRAWLLPAERPGRELLAMGACTLLGGFNDWSTVVWHHVYDYAVPAELPTLSTVPLWMLLLWGLILRSLLSLFAWMAPHHVPRRDSWIGARRVDSAGLRVAIELLLVALTRACIYRLYADPIWSWAPFALALAAHAAVLRPDAVDRRLMAAFLLAGPAIEALYIQAGGLHRYHLGWIGGVPVWIVLWWVLAIPVWRDLAGRSGVLGAYDQGAGAGPRTTQVSPNTAQPYSFVPARDAVMKRSVTR